MQKYRRWTDQATGINPFTNPNPKATFKLTTLITSAIITVTKLNIISIFILPIVLSLLLQNLAAKNRLLGKIIGLPLQGLNILLGLWGIDDGNFRNWIQKNSNKGNIILSNSVSILDTFYYMSIIPGARFIISNPEQNRFQVISGINAVLRVLRYKQPYFNVKPSANSQKLRSLVSKQLAKGYSCVLFYQGIRTNGLGTIKISKKLSTQLYEIQKNYCIAHLKYTSTPQGLFSVVSTPAVLFLIALSTISISLRVRCNPIAIATQHSEDDVQKDIDNFLMANAAKLLDTNPADYFEFLEFYNKSQQGGYTQLAQQEKNK